MSNKILYEPKEGTTGFWGLRDVPDEPVNDATFSESTWMRIFNKWNDDLESYKSKKLEIVNAEEVLKGFDVNRVAFFMDHCLWSQLPNYHTNIFDLPIGYEFKGEYNCSDCPITDCSSTICPKKVLRLVKTETKESIFEKVLKEVPLKTKIKVCVEMAMIDMLTKAGYRPEKSWSEEEDRQLSVLMQSAKLCSESIINEISQPEPEESQAEEFTDEEYAEGFADGQEFIKSSIREEIENDRDFNTSDEVGEYYDGMRKAYYRTLKLLDTITTEK